MTNPLNLSKSSDPYSILSAKIADLERRVSEANNRPMRIPLLSEDPPETDPTTIWMFPDGRLRMRHRNTADTAWVYREWVATAPGSDTSVTAPAAPVVVPTTQQVMHLATWTESYQQDGDARTDTNNLYYGSSGSDSYNGKQQSLIGFDYATIAAQLAGSTINAVSLRLQNLHSWYNAGVNIYFGIHNFTSQPTDWAGGGIPLSKHVNHRFAKTQERIVTLPLVFAQAIRDGTGKGIALEAPSSSREYYGYAAGVGSGYNVPALIINYTK